jgi:hypothetical protein
MEELRCRSSLMTSLHTRAQVPVPKWSKQDSVNLVDHYLQRYSKNLSPEQKTNLETALSENAKEVNPEP